MGKVEFFYDLVSPYSYLAYGRAVEVCAAHGAELVLRPMLLGALHNAVGLQAPIEIKPKGRYQLEDIHRWADYYGLALRFPEPFPFRTLKTMRAAIFSEERGLLEPFTPGGFRPVLDGGRRAEGYGGGRRGRSYLRGRP